MATVETGRIRALIAMMYPTDMTPTAKRAFEQVLDEEESDG